MRLWGGCYEDVTGHYEQVMGEGNENVMEDEGKHSGRVSPLDISTAFLPAFVGPRGRDTPCLIDYQCLATLSVTCSTEYTHNNNQKK